MSARERFVVLLHTGQGDDHWDLMLSTGEGLATWQCPADPCRLRLGESFACTRLADHRAEYLEFEGPVSGGRGRVLRLAEGTWRAMRTSADRWEFELAGPDLCGAFVLERQAESADRWRLRRTAPPAASPF